MRLERTGIDRVPRLEGRWAVTLGTFDGVHRGHAAVLGALAAAGGAAGIDGTCVVTFDPHPRRFLDPTGSPPLLTSIDERATLIGATGPDVLLVLDFDAPLASMPYDAFVHDVLRARLGMVHFVLGHDVHFGHARGGNAHSVRPLGERSGFSVDEVESLSVDGAPVSSTRIRRALVEGEFERAVFLLGHPYLYAGTVVRGRGLGRRLGFPTANLALAADRLRPALGVYAGWARWEGGDWVPAVANIGRGPTVAPDDPARVEVHLPGLDVDLYDRRIELALAVRLRPETRFGSLEELGTAIGHDVATAPARLAGVPEWGRPERIDDLWGPATPAG